MKLIRLSAKRFYATSAAVLVVAAILAVGLLPASAHSSLTLTTRDSEDSSLTLTPPPGSLTPSASGKLQFSFSEGVLSGRVIAKELPAQGTKAAYGLWFVNTETGDKAFLGALIQTGEHTILFQTGGKGTASFSASTFTTGPHAGESITFASSGHNLFIVLVENSINFVSPSPLGPAISVNF